MEQTQTDPHWVLQWGARAILFALLAYSVLVINSPIKQAWLWEIVYGIVRDSLTATGGTIPDGDIPVFATTVLVAGWSVSVDASLWLILVLPFLPKRYWIPVVILITLTHAFAGYLGFAFMVFGLMTAFSIWLVLGPTAWAGLRFIAVGLLGEDEDDARDMANKVIAGLLTAAAFILYWAVSYDEFFMVLQRFLWMLVQGWNYVAQAVLIALSMVALAGFMMLVVIFYLAFPRAAEWVEERGDSMMYVVFSLIMYYLVRGVVQNGLGYVPWEIPYTGIAPDLLAAGFIITWAFSALLNNSDSFEAAANKLLLLDVKILESIRRMRIVKEDEEETAAA